MSDIVVDSCVVAKWVLPEPDTDAFEIAVKYDRSAYDALFVALSQKLGVPGVTADEPLFHAVHADFPHIELLRHL